MALIKDETHTSRKNANIGQLCLMLRPLGRFAFGKTPRGPRCARQARQLGSALVVEVGKLVAQIVNKRLNITYERL